MLSGMTLGRYFGMRFLSTVLGVFAGVFALIALIDYIELMRRTADLANVSALLVARASIYRVPQVAERLMPFCVLVGAMSCYLNLSRRLELVVARAAGMSAWQFTAPAVIVAMLLGALAAAVYNPISAALQERSKRIEAELFKQDRRSGLQEAAGGGFWVRQKSAEGQAIINALSSREQGIHLGGVTIFTFLPSGQFQERVEAKSAILERGHWRLQDARIYAQGSPPAHRASYLLNTNLTPAQVRETFATPETVSFWQLPQYIDTAEHAGPGGVRLPPAIPQATIAAVHACRHGPAGGRLQPALLPLRRCANHGFGWRQFGLSALCFVEGNRGLKQGRADAPSGSGLAACVGRWSHGAGCVAVPGGRVMAGSTATRPRSLRGGSPFRRCGRLRACRSPVAAAGSPSRRPPPNRTS